MRTSSAILSVFAAALTMLAVGPTLAAPAVGDPAPEFRLQDQNGDWHTLADYRGKWVALYFYPKDDTPGCTKQACTFRDNIFAFRKVNAEIIGVSLDDVASHREFAEKYSLPFTLLSDKDGSTAKSYGVLRNFGLMKLASRQSFLIDPDGQIVKHYEDVDPEQNSTEMLADIEAGQAGSG